MPSTQLSLPAVHNTNLFSRHFLEQRLPSDPVWTGLREEAAACFARIKEIHTAAAKMKLFASRNERLAEDEYIVPVLHALGWESLPQSSLKIGGKRKVPDHSLFLSREAKERAAGALARATPDLSSFAREMTTLLEAKHWGRPLDDQSPRLGEPDPTAQTVNYLDTVHTYNPAVEWAIVCNGASWRLLYNGADSRMTDRYEVSLAALVEGDDLDAFALYFYPFFSAAAFRSPEGTGRARLQLAIERSAEYAAGVRDRIKDLVYTQVIGRLGDAFLRSWRREATGADRDAPPTPELLDTIYDASLTYLYRMLFVLYAESRGLLPVHENGYARQSMDNLRRRVYDAVMRDEPVSSKTRDFARDLEDLRRLIDEGEPAFNLPQYNGGLFRRVADDFPDRYEPADDGLLLVIFLLTADAVWDERREQWIAQGFYDYSSLTVRHLGDIYEGLLEFRLAVAERPLVSARKEGRDVWRAADEEEIARHENERLSNIGRIKRAARVGGAPEYLPAGSVYATNDKGERKAGGSYYTPHDIVEYIVAETVLPLLDARLEEATKLFDAWGKVVGKDDRQAGLLAETAFETIFGLTVCDPAMGSGHFLVHTVNVVADRIATSLARYNADSSAESSEHPGDPVRPLLAAMRREIVEGMRAQGIAIRPQDEENLRDAGLIRRLVLKRCIYGVDINRRAVELAKLSLWLHNFVVGAPLSFLDHHLKCGNSLVGARWRDAVDGIQHILPLFSPDTGGIVRATDELIELNRRLDATFAQVAESKRQSEDADRILQPFIELLDIWTARFFAGNAPERSRFHALLTGDTYRVEPGWGGRFLFENAETFRDGVQIAAAQKAFQWELEFPEVFFQQGEIRRDAGFDAVIGNPPYVRQEVLAELKPYLKSVFASFAGAADLYIYFYELALRLTRPNGRVGFISSGTFARANFAQPFRQWLPTVADFVTVIDYGENQPFVDAEMVRPSIVILERHDETISESGDFQALFIQDRIPSSLREAMMQQGITCDRAVFEGMEWKFQRADINHLFAKISANKKHLVELSGLNINRGILTGLNEAFIVSSDERQDLISQDASSEDLIVPVLSGSDLRPWYQHRSGEYLIFTRRGVDIERYPAIRSHLEQFRERLEPKPVSWSGSKWPGRKEGNYKWYEVQDSIDYHGEFTRPKIMWPDISKLPRFSWDESGWHINNTGYILTGAEPWLLGLLQSRVLWFAVSQISTPLRLRGGLWQYRMFNQFIERLPVPTMTKKIRHRLTDIAMQTSTLAQQRYDVARQTLNRVVADLGTMNGKPTERLSEWYSLDFATFRAELKKSFKGSDVPVSERDEWERYLADQKGKYERFTSEIIALEVELNDIVYDLFDLNADERRLIEEETKYSYGEP